MYRKAYKVKGKDVNDYMVMQNFAYFSYASRMLENFLFDKGYSKGKLNQLKIGLQKCNEEVIFQKQLMFTQSFFVSFECFDITNDKQKMNIKNRFFNDKNELCAIVVTQWHWCEQVGYGIITPPQKVVEPFRTLKLNNNIPKVKRQPILMQ